MDKQTPQKNKKRRRGHHLEVEERTRIQERFLTIFAQTANVMLACRAVSIGRSTAYEWRKTDEEFSLRWADAEEEANEAIEAEIHRRAIVGVDEPVYYKGQLIDTIKRYGDTLLIFLAKARMPHKYRDNWEGEMPPLGGSRAQASASANVAVFNIGGIVKRPEDMTDEELHQAEETLQPGSDDPPA